MPQETFDYAAILADARAKRAALDAFIASLENAQALGALGQTGESAGTPGGFSMASTPVDLPVGALMGQSVPNAIKLYLAACRRKQTAREIEAALKEGGVESTSKNFDIIVSNALRKLKGSGAVLQFKDGWALAELYPESLRSRLAQQEGSVKKPPKKKKAKRGQPKKAEAKDQKPAVPKTEPRVQEMPKAS